ncbi:MAG: hypothetical protein QOG91_371, partial [Candidatus Parcubacteria bacterium]|nr:hypothetical protein [Candidatus Parcubacteria bacterium]
MDMTLDSFLGKPAPARRKIVLAIGNKNIGGSFELLCLILEHDPSSVIRHEAAFALGASKRRAAVPRLIAA